MKMLKSLFLLTSVVYSLIYTKINNVFVYYIKRHEKNEFKTRML